MQPNVIHVEVSKDIEPINFNQDSEPNSLQQDPGLVGRTLEIQECATSNLENQKHLERVKNAAFFFTGVMVGGLGSTLTTELVHKVAKEVLFPVPIAFALVTFGISATLAAYAFQYSFWHT
jgi:hypothetical protein